MWVGAELGEEGLDPLFDVVADGPDFFDGSTCGVVEVPVDVADAWEHGAGVATCHGDDDVGGGDDFVGPFLWQLGSDVDSEFGHGGDGYGVDLVGGF